MNGRHRVQAHIDLGRTEIAAEVLGPVDHEAIKTPYRQVLA